MTTAQYLCGGNKTLTRQNVVTLLLKNGASIFTTSADGKTALYLACQEGHVDVAELLLKQGSDPSVRAEESGWTPLIAASSCGHSAVVQLLLNNGADVDHRSYAGRTALMEADENGHGDTTKTLLRAGASPAIGNTAMTA